jgi:tetratricopeptide (TPR) repeat protein
MSLLMEALRKAEQVKKKAAGVDTSPEPQDRNELPDELLPPESQPSIQKDEDSGAGLELTGHGPLKIEREDDTAEPAFEDTIDTLDIWEIEEEVTEITLVEEPISSDLHKEENDEGKAVSDPAVALPAEVPAQVPDIPASALELQPGSTIPLAPVIPTASASVEASRRTARAVFVAKNKHQRLARKRQVLFMVGVAGVVLFGLAGFIFFSHRTMMTFPTPTTMPITTIKKDASPQEPPFTPKDAPDTGSVKPTAFPSADTGEKPVATGGPGSTEQKSAGEQIPTSAQTGATLSHTPAARETLEATPQSKIVPASSSQRIPASTSESPSKQDFPTASQHEVKPALPPGLQTPSQPMIHIAHQAAQAKSEPLMTAAYAAYQRGDFAQSKQNYQQILQADPEHRGALLGLAALALRLKETGQARDLYLHLLERDPSDPLARVGLMAVMPTGDPVSLESELKLLLDVHPNIAPLFFSLGNLYAAGKRWGEAQQAYFNALQAAGKAAPQAEMVSPDYPYNLAVSLEHLNQSALAVKYYREALQLAARQPAGFDKEALRYRLEIFNQVGTR